MAQYNTYDISLKINGVDTKLEPLHFSFSMFDSIHSLMPKLYLTIKDFSGMFQENLFQLENSLYDIAYTYDNTTIRNKYVVFDDETNNLLGVNYYAGDVSIRTIHEYSNIQEIKSKNYNNLISNIIRELIGTYNFNGTNISATGCFTIWTQPLMTDSQFIVDILLPNSFSNNSNKSPFFCWIDNKNNFNFKSFYEMINFKTKATLEFKPGTIINNADEITNTTILKINRIKTGSTVHKSLRQREVYRHSTTDGSLATETDYNYSYPMIQNKYMPILQNNKLTGYKFLFNEYTQDNGLKECYQGQQINSMKEALFFERMMITLPLNLELNAGDLIQLKLPHPLSANKKESSIHWGGNWLIEESEHKWDMNRKQGFSEFLVSKKFIDIDRNRFKYESQLTKSS